MREDEDEGEGEDEDEGEGEGEGEGEDERLLTTARRKPPRTFSRYFPSQPLSSMARGFVLNGSFNQPQFVSPVQKPRIQRWYFGYWLT